ncbi:hypothetical protein Pmani_039473 [Petrolisthes manimaculis]|uniref:Uncharacterized protein n=1 Tax=Petrolisthes manimaculis TaxID=1843537 RepID=A0AAE1NDL5_9EUCA|nr:hypothetical protein Pmani_039473 [Petrolisthes manimaculis]
MLPTNAIMTVITGVGFATLIAPATTLRHPPPPLPLPPLYSLPTTITSVYNTIRLPQINHHYHTTRLYHTTNHTRPTLYTNHHYHITRQPHDLHCTPTTSTTLITRHLTIYQHHTKHLPHISHQYHTLTTRHLTYTSTISHQPTTTSTNYNTSSYQHHQYHHQYTRQQIRQRLHDHQTESFFHSSV